MEQFLKGLHDILKDQKISLFIFGVIFVLLATLGKIDIKEFKIDLGKFGRAIALFFGSLFIVISLFLPNPSNPSNSVVTPPPPPPPPTTTSAKKTLDNKLQELLDSGYEQLEMRNYKEAENFYDKAVTESSFTSPDAWNGLGASRVGLGKDEEAIDAFKKAIEFDNNNPAHLINLGNVYIKTRDYKNAIKPLAKATRIDPKLAQAWAGYAISKCHTQQYPEAIDAFNKSISIKGSDPIMEGYKSKTIQAMEANDTSFCPVP